MMLTDSIITYVVKHFIILLQCDIDSNEVSSRKMHALKIDHRPTGLLVAVIGVVRGGNGGNPC